MKRTLALSLLLIQTSVIAQTKRTEMTGSDAEAILKRLMTLPLTLTVQPGQPIDRIDLDAIHCTLVPSPRATASCSLEQDGLTIDAGAASDTIYFNFVRNGAHIELNSGVSELELRDVTCERYTVYRGTTKCFFVSE